MLSADGALAGLINRTAQAYVQNAPSYIVYRERTHITAPSLGRSQDIDRLVKVRQSDDAAVMQDLPRGAVRTGQAFPIIPYFDPFTQFSFSWYANLKRVDITLQRSQPFFLTIPPADPSVDLVLPYFSFWDPSYLSLPGDPALHLRVAPTPALGTGFYPYDIVEDPQTQLPAHVEMRTTDDSEIISFDYRVIEGHWTIVRGTFTSNEHVGPLAFQVIAETTFDQFAFPLSPPDPRL